LHRRWWSAPFKGTLTPMALVDPPLVASVCCGQSDSARLGRLLRSLCCPFRSGSGCVALFLEREDALALLRKKVEKAGSQLAWSKKTGIWRPNLNSVLNERRPLAGAVIPALGLEIAYTRENQAKQSAAQVFRYHGVLDLLREEVSKAGGQVAWSKKTGVNRSHLNLTLNRRRPLTESIIAALQLRVVYVRNSKTGSIQRSPRKRRDAQISC
jgi:lambda repressor-like predicted transcriptional regulator